MENKNKYKKVVLLVNQEQIENWVIQLKNELELSYDVKFKIINSSLTIKKVNVYNFFSQLILRFEQKTSTELKTNLFQLSKINKESITTDDCEVNINLTPDKHSNCVNININNNPIDINSINYYLFQKQGYPIVVSSTNSLGENIVQYQTSNNSPFLSKRRVNLIAAITDIIYYTLKSDETKPKSESLNLNPNKLNYPIIYILSYLFVLLVTKYKKLTNSIVWHIAVQKKDNLEIIPLPQGEFWADPFFIETKKGTSIIFERMKKNATNGIISSIEINKQKTAINDMLEEPFHLSFPFTLNIENKFHVIPESKQANSIICYEYDIENNKKMKSIELIKNIKAVDSIIQFYEDKYWLFCTQQSTSLSNSGDVLCIYMSNSITDKWTPHLQNPIKLNNSNARNAGKIFVINNKLYRPVQNGSYTYGGSIKIMEITKLTEFEFIEKEVKEYKPTDFHPKARALHSINYSNEDIVIDLLIDRKYAK